METADLVSVASLSSPGKNPVPVMSSSTGTLSVDPKTLVGWPVELDCQIRGSESLLKKSG